MKITTRCGSSAIDGLNGALLAKAAGAKVLKTNKLRADTTVVPANVAYPTDSGLLAKGVAKMAKAIKSLQAKGMASRPHLVRSRSVQPQPGQNRRTDRRQIGRSASPSTQKILNDRAESLHPHQSKKIPNLAVNPNRPFSGASI
jgi:IS5 family transposase